MQVNLSRLILKLKGLDSEQILAEKIGISQYSINSWLNYEHFPGTKSLQKLALYLGISLDQLLEILEGDRPEQKIKTAEAIFAFCDELSPQEKLRLLKFLIDSLQSDTYIPPVVDDEFLTE